MILDATPINEADARSPAKFRLPGLEGLRDWLRGEVGGGKAPWLAKLDIQNAFWSIKLPRPSVHGGHQCCARRVSGEAGAEQSSIHFLTHLAYVFAEIDSLGAQERMLAPCTAL